jgi:phosphomannomutase
MFSMISWLLPPNITPSLAKRTLIIFDLDGTLTESKADMDAEMANLFAKLLEKKMVAVIGGGPYEQFRHQLIGRLRSSPAFLKNVFLFPTTSMAFYRYQGTWKKVYAHLLTKKEKTEIYSAFRKAFGKINYIRPEKLYGKDIEDRQTQVSFSPLGQQAPVEAKKQWNKKFHKSIRMSLRKILQKFLPQFEVKVGGLTTIDVTRKGIDKSYGIRQIQKHLHIPIKDMLFVGDALFPGGNDYAARKTGVACIAVRGPGDTKKLIRQILAD